MKKLVFVLITFSALCSLSANTAESGILCWEKTPWEKLKTILYNQGIDTSNINVTTQIEVKVANSIKAELSKTFHVRGDIDFTHEGESVFAGDILCLMMEKKYEGKAGEKYDYYKIQYSADDNACYQYAKQYPDSPHATEMISKGDCLFAFWIFIAPDSICHSEVQKAFDVWEGKSCQYEGYMPISLTNTHYCQTVKDWNRIIAKCSTPNFDCGQYSSFRDEHTMYLSVYYYIVKDSINSCSERHAWKEAVSSGTVEALRNYVNNYPSTRNAYNAKRRILDIEAWSNARKENSHAAYAEYCEKFPEGDSISIAQEIMQTIEETDWMRIKDSKNWKDYYDYIKKYSNGIYSEQAFAKMDSLWNTTKTDINKMFEIVGPCQVPDSGIIFLSNIDKRGNDISFKIYTGKKTKKIVAYKLVNSGDYCYFKIKNGEYEVVIGSPSIPHIEIEPIHGKMVVENNIYCLQYFTYDLHDSSLSQEARYHKYSDNKAYKKNSEIINQIVSLEFIKINMVNEDCQIKNGMIVYYQDGLQNSLKYDNEIVSGNDLKESKESFLKTIQDDPETPLIFHHLSNARLGLRLVLYNSYKKKNEVYDFTTAEIKKLAEKYVEK